MSQPLHESVLLIAEDSQHEDISRRSDAVAEQLSKKIEKPDEGEAFRKCMENCKEEKVTDSELFVVTPSSLVNFFGSRLFECNETMAFIDI